jgi:hypothetical protein
MPATTIGLSTLSFGTVSQGTAIVTSYEETIKCDPVELIGGNGAFSAVAFANPNSSASITLVSGSATASIGGAITFTSSSLSGISTLYIESATKTATNDGFTETQINGIGYAELGSAS